jgi:hypothetical protein
MTKPFVVDEIIGTINQALKVAADGNSIPGNSSRNAAE